MSNNTPTPQNKKKILNAYQSQSPKAEPRWQLVSQYTPLLKSLVSRMRIFFPAHTSIEDIYSIGLAGLIAASQNYDESKKATFGHYANTRIRGALLDEMRRMDWMPRSERANVKRYRKAIDELEQELQREATKEEICHKLNITELEQRRLEEQSKPLSLIPLDTLPSSAGTEVYSLQETIPDLTQQDGRDITESNDTRRLLRLALEELKETPKKVLIMYYVKGLRLGEIAKVLDLSESRICQIHTEAIVDLRTEINKHLNT